MNLLQECMLLALFLLKIYVNLIQFKIMQPNVITFLTALVFTGAGCARAASKVKISFELKIMFISSHVKKKKLLTRTFVQS